MTTAEVPTLLTVEQAAEVLQCSRGWIYSHADDLPVIRLGNGPKAPIRIDARQLVNRPQSLPERVALDL